MHLLQNVCKKTICLLLLLIAAAFMLGGCNAALGTGHQSIANLCSDSSDITNAEIKLSPIARRSTIVTTVQKSADFSKTERVTYAIIDQPINQLTEGEKQENITVFEFKDNVLIVGTDKLYALINLNDQYEVPLPLLIEAKSDQRACALNYTLRFSDEKLAVEPDWEVNPILRPSYEFDVDCPAAHQVAGKIGDDQRNEIYNVTYKLENVLDSSKSNDKTAVAQYLSLNDRNGEISTRHSAPPKNSSFWFKVSASAVRQRKIYSYVSVKYGTCSGAERKKHEQKFKLHFTLHCAHQGDIVGSLPREVDGSKMASYVMFPGIRQFSLTVDGKIRVLAASLDPRTYNNIRINAQTETGEGYIFRVNVTAEPCMGTKKSLPVLGVAEVNCPQLGTLIVDLSRLHKFRQALNTNNLINPVLSTNMPMTVQVSGGTSLVWTRKPSSLADDDPPLEITIFARNSSTSSIPLGSVKVTVRQQVPECKQMNKTVVHTQKSLLVRCPTEDLAVAFIDPTSLPKSTSNSSSSVSESARFTLCCSEYYEIGRFSGIISIIRVPPPELTSLLGVQVSLPPNADNPEGLTVFGAIYLFADGDTSSCSDAETADDMPPPDSLTFDALPPLVCTRFTGTEESPSRRVSNANFGVVSLNKPGSFVAQVSATWSYANNAPIYWSLAASSVNSGYRIEQSTGDIYTTVGDPDDIVVVNASAANARPCLISLRPKRLGETSYADDGLINHQPPHLTTGGPTSIKPRSLPCVSAGDGSSLVKLDEGTFIIPITAYDADTGVAGKIYYSLCTSAQDTKCTSLHTIIPPIDEQSTPISLTIDPQTGFLFATNSARVTAANAGSLTDTFKVRVKVSNDASVAADGDTAVSAKKQKKLIGVAADAGDVGVVSIQLVCSPVKTRHRQLQESSSEE